MKGKKHYNWNGGIKIHLGYRCIKCEEHPFAVNGYVREHRLIMEKKIGRFLKPNEVVHHIDGDKLNNNIKNLKLFERGKHIGLHNSKRIGQIPWNKGKKGLQVAWNKGKTFSEELKRKMSKSHKGQIPWNKGKKRLQIPWNKGLNKNIDKRIATYSLKLINNKNAKKEN